MKKYLRPIKERFIKVDNETLEILFKLITLRVDQEFINKYEALSLIDHSDIYNNMQKSILDSIPDVKNQHLEKIREKQRDKEREQMAESRDKPKFVEEIKAQLGEDQEEIITTQKYSKLYHTVCLLKAQAHTQLCRK